MEPREQVLKAYDEMFNRAAAIVADGEEVPATALAINELGIGLPLPLDAIPKSKWAQLQDTFLALPFTTAVGIVTEGWAVKVDATSKESAVEALGGVAPSKHPDRTEVVTFVFTLKDGSRMSAICHIERPANVLKREELTVNTKEGALVTGSVLPDSAVEDVVNKA